MTAPVQIALFSFTGVTRAAVKDLVRFFPDAAVTEVRPKDLPFWALSSGKPPQGPLAYMRAGLGMWRGATWPIEPADIPQAKVLVVATPVWAGRLPPPMRACLKGLHGRFSSIAVLATQRGDNPARLQSDVEQAIGQPVHTISSITDAHRSAGRSKQKLLEFAGALGTLAARDAPREMRAEPRAA